MQLQDFNHITKVSLRNQTKIELENILNNGTGAVLANWNGHRNDVKTLKKKLTELTNSVDSPVFLSTTKLDKLNEPAIKLIGQYLMDNVLGGAVILRNPGEVYDYADTNVFSQVFPKYASDLELVVEDALFIDAFYFNSPKTMRHLKKCNSLMEEATKNCRPCVLYQDCNYNVSKVRGACNGFFMVGGLRSYVTASMMFEFGANAIVVDAPNNDVRLKEYKATIRAAKECKK